jgi:hypothetical protein
VWSSAVVDINQARDIAWGDVNGDGDLDLIAGGMMSVTLYETRSPRFPLRPQQPASVRMGLYRVIDPAGQPLGGADLPFRTSALGYLQGRRQLNLNDGLAALWLVTLTDKWTLYHTSATPTLTGLNFYTVTQTGVQTLTVSAARPLILFDLIVALEWNAEADSTFLAQLQQNLAKTSAALYDWTNGQAALGRVSVYQDRQGWNEADVRIFASNQERPIADRGGVVTQATVLTFTRPITFAPGEIRIGPTWNRYGDPQVIGDDWPNVLAHELGHYALFLEDTYLGIDDDGIMTPIDSCRGTAMSDPYSDVYSEFRFRDANWEADCGGSLAELADWEIITRTYAALRAPPPINEGPGAIPFAFTQIDVSAPPGDPQPLLDDANVPLGTAGSALSDGRAYLRQPGRRLIDLGRPVVNFVLARGAREGDELCVFGASSFACSRLSNRDPAQWLARPLWRPDVTLTPISATLLSLRVVDASGGLITATVYPNGESPQSLTLTTGVTRTLSFDRPAFEVAVDLQGDEANERLITGYATGSGPGRTRDHGGPGRTRDHGAFSAGDGSLTIYPPENLPEDVFTVLQTATSFPELPSGLAPIGRAYHVQTSGATTVFTGGSLSFQYLGLDVLLADVPGAPLDKEMSLAVQRWNGATWTQLTTTLNFTQNFASAPLPGPGLYVLTAGHAAPAISAVAPASATVDQAHSLTVIGQNFLAPLDVTLRGQAGTAYRLAVGLVNTQTIVAATPVTLPADLYDLELRNAGGLTATLVAAFALRAAPPAACFFDDFASGWGQWIRTGEWGIVTVDGDEAATDSPDGSYRTADRNSTRITSITSRPFSLAACAEPVLSFRHDYAIAVGPGPYRDWGRVELSIDGGLTWRPVISYTGGEGYPAALAAADEWDGANWRTVSLALPTAGAATARLRFSLVVDAVGSDKGWLIDDVAVKPASGALPRTFLYLPLVNR